MDTEYNSNLVITGDALFHRRLDRLMQSIYQADLQNNVEAYISILYNICSEITPRFDKKTADDFKDRYARYFQMYSVNKTGGSKAIADKQRKASFAYSKLRELYGDIIAEANKKGVFLREIKEKPTGIPMSQFFSEIDI